MTGPQVGGHHQYGISEVGFPPLGVGEHPLLHHLEEDGPHVPVGLLQLVQQHNRPGLPTHPLGKLSPLLMAHVARRGADEAGDAVGLHILGHVEAEEGLLAAEQSAGQGTAQLGLAHPGGAQQEEAAHRPPGVLQPQPPPADGPCHRLGRLVLAQQVPAQGGLQPGQGLPVGLIRVAHRDPGPLGQHRPDVLLPHGPGGLLLLPAAAARLQLPPEVPLRVPEHGRLLKVLLADGLGQLPPRLDCPLLQLPQLGREGPGGQPGLGGRLVHQVDGLVGQEPLGQIADGQVHRRLQGAVGDGQVVVGLVPPPEALQNGQGLLPGGLPDGDGLEPPLQGGVLLNILPVLVQGGGPNDLDLPPGEGGL